MRQRIVDELEASRAAADALDAQAEELRRSNAELEQFAYVASHDLQEPLRKVASFCQLLEKRYGDKLDERGTEYIAFAVDGAKRMQVLINDLLTFSRVGRLNATETDVDLDAALDAALANLATAVEESGAVIERPPAGLPTIKGDPTLLAMMWQNLIGNAVKFRRDGVAPRIVIDCRTGRRRRPELVFFVVGQRNRDRRRSSSTRSSSSSSGCTAATPTPVPESGWRCARRSSSSTAGSSGSTRPTPTAPASASLCRSPWMTPRPPSWKDRRHDTR